MRHFTLPLTGGCQCGRHRYAISASPLTVYACHCRDCQTQSGSAFGLSMPVLRNALTGDLDDLGVWERKAASDRIVKARFCQRCGTRLFHEPSRNPDVVNVKPGTLDDTSWLRPIGHLWLDSAQPWIQVPDGGLRYRAQPDSFEALFERFGQAYPEG